MRLRGHMYMVAQDFGTMFGAPYVLVTAAMGSFMFFLESLYGIVEQRRRGSIGK